MNKGFIFLPLDGQDSFGPKKKNTNKKNYRHNKNKRHNKNYKPRYHYKSKDKRNKSNKSSNNYDPNLNTNYNNKNTNKTYPDRYDIDLIVNKDNPFKFDFSKKNNLTRGIIDIDISRVNDEKKIDNKTTSSNNKNNDKLKNDFKIGEDIFVGFSPERIDPGNNENSLEKIPKIVKRIGIKLKLL